MEQSHDKHISLDKWLSSLGLMQYAELFDGYRGVESILLFTEKDFKTLGIKTSAHRARMATSLHLLKEKLDMNKGTKQFLTFPETRTTCLVAESWDTKMNQSDYAQVMYQPLCGSSTESDTASDYHLHNQSVISKHLWYHGPIPRHKAEVLVKENGDFLVRDSNSKKGDYVLTCFWNGSPLHFMVNRQVLRDSGSDVVKVQYQFEQELCDTVPYLINLYIRNKKCVSDASGAVISKPVNRRISADSFLSRQYTDNLNPVNFTSKTLQKSGSQPLLSLSDSNNALDHIQKSESKSSDSTSVKLKESRDDYSEHRSESAKNISATQVSNSLEAEKTKSPPPKPSRVPTFKLHSNQRPRVTVKNKQLYEDEKDYSDYSAVKSWPKDVKRTPESVALLTDFYDTARSVISLPKHASPGNSNSAERNHIYDVTAVTFPEMSPPSKFECYEYNSNILTSNNKPLEKLALSVIQPMLLDTDIKELAMHLTLLDLDLLKVVGNHNLGVGVKSGLELITLPQGAQLRKDALERFHCLKYFVATSVLLCVQYTQRVQMISQWIQIANETKTALGNLYAFAYIMEALQCPQIQRLKNTWIATQHHHNSIKQLYDTRLKTAYKAMLDADTALPLQNVTLPYVIPVMKLLEMENLQSQDMFHSGDLNIVLAHLDIARIICEQYGFYKVTSEHIIGKFRPVRDILEVFDTRMHLRFLWGAKGACVTPVERYTKYEEILNVLSQKCEPHHKSAVKESSL